MFCLGGVFVGFCLSVWEIWGGFGGFFWVGFFFFWWWWGFFSCGFSSLDEVFSICGIPAQLNLHQSCKLPSAYSPYFVLQ